MKAKITEVPATMETQPPAALGAAVDYMKDHVASATANMEATQIKMKQGMQKAMKTAEEFVAFSQGNIEALMKAGQIWTTGMQDLSKHIATTAQTSMEESISTFKALTTVKSLNDAFELQAAFARGAMEKTITESGRITDASFKLTEQAMAPLTARVSVAVEKIAKAA